jgi:hypothetical protein
MRTVFTLFTLLSHEVQDICLRKDSQKLLLDFMDLLEERGIAGQWVKEGSDKYLVFNYRADGTTSDKLLATLEELAEFLPERAYDRSGLYHGREAVLAVITAYRNLEILQRKYYLTDEEKGEAALLSRELLHRYGNTHFRNSMGYVDEKK